MNTGDIVPEGFCRSSGLVIPGDHESCELSKMTGSSDVYQNSYSIEVALHHNNRNVLVEESLEGIREAYLLDEGLYGEESVGSDE